MKKFFKLMLTFGLALILNLGLTACNDDDIVKKLQNEYGAVLEGGNFTEGSTLKLDKLEVTTDEAKTIFQSLEDFGVDIDDESQTYIYDISVEKNGKEVQPNGTVKLTIPMSSIDGVIGYEVYHIDDQGEIEKITASYENGKVIFETDGFSIYVFVPINSNSQEALVTSLKLDAHNAGFTYDGVTIADKTIVEIGAEITPNAEQVLVYGVTVEEDVNLVKDTDYTIDLGGLDFTKEGVYTITYTYIKNTSIKATLTIEVREPRYAFSAVVGQGEGKIYHNSEEKPNGYFGEHKEGDLVTLKAEASANYEFEGWYLAANGGTLISTSSEYTFTVGNADTRVEARFKEKNVTPTFTYEGNQSSEAISYLGQAVFVSPKYILVNGTPLNEITDESIKGKITYKWLDRKTGLEVSTDDDITLDGTTYQFGNNSRTVGDEIVGPCIAGEYEFALYYDGVKQFSVYKAVKENTFKKITTVAEFSTTEGVGLLQSMNYYTIVGVVDGKLYVMQMPKDGSKVSDSVVEAEARLVTADENGIISLGKELDYVFASMRYYINEWKYYPSDSSDRENLLVDFTTGYYGSSLEQPNNNTFDYSIYRKGYVSLSGGRITREKGSVDTSSYGHLTVFDNNGAVKIYEPRKGQTVNNALRLVKDGDKYVFTSIPADKDTRESYDIFIYKCYEEVNATYQFYGDLNKTYDGEAVSFNIYEKCIEVYTENSEDIYSLAKMETVRFRFTDAEENYISDSYIDSDGNVKGPKDVGQYIMWIELKEKGEDGEEWITKAKIHSFEIKEAEE